MWKYINNEKFKLINILYKRRYKDVVKLGMSKILNVSPNILELLKRHSHDILSA